MKIDKYFHLYGRKDDVVFEEIPEPETHWIPCSERLPEEYGEYMITWITSASKKRFIGIVECEVTSVWNDNGFMVEWLFEDYMKAYPDVEVIAWMPLPEPFRG